MANDRETERLDKYICSVTSFTRSVLGKEIRKRGASLNGKQIKDPSVKVREGDVIEIAGMEITVSLKPVYLMMNKPAGVVSATQDNRDKTVIDILPAEYKRPGLFPAGRLDKDTEGLLIITNDGDFAHKMLSPSKKVYKQYEAELDGEITDDIIRAFKEGIVFSDGTKCLPAVLRFADEKDKNKAVVKICEGKFHQVKKMFAVCGLKVVHLQRISVGNLYLDSKLPIGSAKKLTKLDVSTIFVGKIH